MTNTFRRRAMMLAASLESAWRRGSVAPGAFRAGLLLLTASLLLIVTGCYTVHGITRVGTSDQEVIAEALSTSDDQYEGNPYPEEYSYFASRNGGQSWRSRLAPAEVQWSEGPVDTPRGTYRIEGPNIVLTESNGQSGIVYSTSHWNTSSNRWYQAEQTRALQARVLATRPTAITYDPISGNLIAGMGIQGVVVGVPNGQWVPVAVDQYSPISFTRELKLKELLNQHAFWITVFVFPISMIALSFFFKDLLRKSEADFTIEAPNQRTVGIGVVIPFMVFVGIFIFVCCAFIYTISGLGAALGAFVLSTATAAIFFRTASRSTAQDRGCLIMFFSMPCTAFAILITASFLAGLGRADLGGTGVLAGNNGILQIAFAFVSVIAAISGSTIAWRRQWRTRWWVIIVSYAAMASFVAFPFLGWVQSEVSVLWPRLASFVLCLAIAFVVYLSLRVEPLSVMANEELTPQS